MSDEATEQAAEVVAEETKPEASGVLVGKAQLGAAAFADAGDSTGRNLVYVQIRPDGSARATNGRYLIIVPGDGMDPAEFPAIEGLGGAIPAEGVEIPAETCKEAAKAIKRDYRPVMERVHVGALPDGKARLTVMANFEPRTLTAPKSEGRTLPDLDQFIAPREGRIVFGLDPKYLKTICEYAIKHGTRAGLVISVDPKQADKNGPILFEVRLSESGKTAQIALMPMRVD